jgi:lipid A disaccharide synthetase
LLNLVSNKQAVKELEERFSNMHQVLKQDAANKAAEAVISFLGKQH